eukprot:241687-Pelagomonas_calceolata.AAC.1
MKGGHAMLCGQGVKHGTFCMTFFGNLWALGVGNLRSNEQGGTRSLDMVLVVRHTSPSQTIIKSSPSPSANCSLSVDGLDHSPALHTPFLGLKNAMDSSEVQFWIKLSGPDVWSPIAWGKAMREEGGTEGGGKVCTKTCRAHRGRGIKHIEQHQLRGVLSLRGLFTHFKGVTRFCIYYDAAASTRAVKESGAL